VKKTRSISLISTISVATVFVAGSAFAAQNVANTSQKGSLLVWPLVTVNPGGENGPQDTLIEISNDGIGKIHVECEYVNERKGRVNFDFDLSAKKTASWDVGTLTGDQVHAPPFPTNQGNPAFYRGNVYRGELICFATDAGRQFQVAWNQLTGTATVINLHDLGASQPRQAFKYNAWAFSARGANGLAADNKNVAQGAPGRLDLTGADAAGAYDACPAYNIANFMPNGARLGNVRTLDNDLAVVSCNQDLREAYKIHRTKLEFTVWNSHEDSFTGAHACVDSVNTISLGVNDRVTQGSNFDYSTLQTRNARFQVRGISATPPCPAPTGAAGLLGVLISSIAIGAGDREAAEIGNTLQGAGLQAGFVLWDPSGAPQAR